MIVKQIAPSASYVLLSFLDHFDLIGNLDMSRKNHFIARLLGANCKDYKFWAIWWFYVDITDDGSHCSSFKIGVLRTIRGKRGSFSIYYLIFDFMDLIGGEFR